MAAYIPEFETEAAICQAFIASVPPEWIVYPETQGWDILLVHRVGGWQIGIEAKKALNAKVLVQAIDGKHRAKDGPDFRAVLVAKVVAENAVIARALGITVIQPRPVERVSEWAARYEKHGPRLPLFMPDLPITEHLDRIGTWWGTWDRAAWFDCFPTLRHRLPDYVPQVAAGVPAPLVLSDWKIKAMRVCVWVERHGTIDRATFRALGIDPSRWMNGHWLKAGSARGQWVAGKAFPGAQLRREHSAIYAKVEADYPEWSKRVTGEAA